MNDPGGVHGIDRIGNLPDDLPYFLGRQRRVLLRVFLEKITECPLDREVVYTWPGFADFDRSYDVGMRDSSTVCCFPEKSCNCGLVRSQFLLQHFDGNDTMGPVLGTIDHCRSTFTNHILQRVSGECRTGKIFSAHGPKLLVLLVGSKRTISQASAFTVDSHH
jgi:hypothetical protein